jgi:hypothetical protein
MPRRVEFTRRSWLLSTIFDGIRDFADAGEWPTRKNPGEGVRTLSFGTLCYETRYAGVKLIVHLRRNNNSQTSECEEYIGFS